MARTDSGGTRAERTCHLLRADILAGQLAPGQRLKFAELAKSYDASVGVIREALTRLAAEGLVRTQSHLGYVVTPLSHEDLEELTTARIELESLVLYRSIREGDMNWEASAVAAHHVLERIPLTEPGVPVQVSDEWSQAHEDFHLALLAGCRNARLLETARTLRREAELYRRWSVSLGHEPDRDIAGEHRGILDAAIARDAALAVERLRDHIAHTAQLLISCAEDEPPTPDDADITEP